MFHYPHSKQYYQQRVRERDDDDGRQRSHSTSPLDYPRTYSPQMDLDRPSRSPSPHVNVRSIAFLTDKWIHFLFVSGPNQDGVLWHNSTRAKIEIP